MSHPQAAPLSITELNHCVKQALATTFRSIWVEGEISDIARPRSGHIYLTLKDKQSQVKGVIWQSNAAEIPFSLQDGQSILCKGDVDVYPARGSYQLIIRKVELQGLGGLQLAFKQLQEKLAREGLFDPAIKKPLPRFPRRIGFLTSPTGAAVRDFLEVARRRWPGIEVLVIPSNVQGAEAATDIVQGMVQAHKIRPRLDVLVVGRGGGSLEDLWCFNDERVVRAISNAEIPIVSAVGHEIDITLSDLASDRRALTPTEAGELVVPSKNDVSEELKTVGLRLQREVRRRLNTNREQLQQLAERPVFSRPHDRISEHARWLDELEMRFEHAIRSVTKTHHQHLASASALLEAVGPLKVLSRGYSVARQAETGNVIRSVGDADVGDTIETVVGDGKIRSTLTEKRS